MNEEKTNKKKPVLLPALKVDEALRAMIDILSEKQGNENKGQQCQPKNTAE